MSLEYEIPKTFEDIESLTQWTWQQFKRTEEEFNFGRDAFYLDELHAEPPKPRNGMLVRADGADWNPDSSVNPAGDPGYWAYADGQWILISRTGTPNPPTVPNDYITFAMMQNIATDRILGRDTAGSGNIEELTLSQVLDFIGSAAQGDILYRGSSDWARLGIGSTGNVLTVASGLPAWGTGPSIVKISTTSASNSASVDFTGLSSTYIAYIVQIANLIPATDGVDLYMRTDENNGASFETANYRYATTSALDDSDSYSIFRATSAGQMVLVLALGNATDENVSGFVYIHNPSSALAFLASWDMVQLNNAALFRRRTGGGTQPVTTAVNAIRFLMSAGNITSGTFTLYGVLP